MERIAVNERDDWRDQAQALGFQFHTIEGEPYWDETAYYRFSLEQIENDIEDPTNEIHAMCMDLVDSIVDDESRLKQLDIPEPYWDYIRSSWKARDPNLYGRMDFSYSGSGSAKLLELNYDTPTSLYESAFFQWVWLEQAMQRGLVPAGSDQFNSIQEELIRVFEQLRPTMPSLLYFSSVRESIEDRGTIDYLRDCATQAGFNTKVIAIEDIGTSMDGRFTDIDDYVIDALFKLYPWEYMMREEYGALLPKCGTKFLEPPWKAILSNKGILPMLWEKHAGHPNLLPAYPDDAVVELPAGWVRKPFFSREGANVTIATGDGSEIAEDGPYVDSPVIRQAYCPLPRFEESYTLIGSWVVGGTACGIGVREDASLITKDTSRFLPHVIW